MNQMQRNVLHLISIVSNKASDGKMDEVEELTETLHGMEVTFVKMYYSKRKTIGADFKPVRRPTRGCFACCLRCDWTLSRPRSL